MIVLVTISSDLGWHADRTAELADLGCDEIRLHRVGRDQRALIEAFGERVLPALRRRR